MTGQAPHPRATRKDIGKVLRAFRDSRGWTLQQVGAATGEHLSNVSKIEHGTRNVGIETLFKIIAVYTTYEGFGRALDQFTKASTMSGRST